MKKLLIFASLFLATSALAQNVQQSGTVTRNHIPIWISSGVIGDGGSSADSPLSSLGITNNGGNGLCINSARQSSAGYNALCFGASTTSPATISLQNFGSATPQGLQFNVNGTVQGFPVVSGSIIAGDVACFLNSGGTLKDCTSTLPSGLTIPSPTISSPTISSPTISSPTISGTPVFSSPLSIGNGGTGQTTQQAALNALAPPPTRAGDIIYYNGTNWVDLAGNNSGTQVLQETSAGVPSWATAGTGTVTSVTCGTGLSGGVITTTGTCALGLTNATLQASPSNPTGTTSASGVMMGVGSTCKLTLAYSTRILVQFSITTTISAAAPATNSVAVRYGTGSAPANGAAVTGTQIGSASGIAIPTNAFSMAVPPLGGIITGLTPGTAYWFDIDLISGNAGGTATVTSISCTAMEF